MMQLYHPRIWSTIMKSSTLWCFVFISRKILLFQLTMENKSDKDQLHASTVCANLTRPRHRWSTVAGELGRKPGSGLGPDSSLDSGPAKLASTDSTYFCWCSETRRSASSRHLLQQRFPIVFRNWMMPEKCPRCVSLGHCVRTEIASGCSANWNFCTHEHSI